MELTATAAAPAVKKEQRVATSCLTKKPPYKVEQAAHPRRSPSRQDRLVGEIAGREDLLGVQLFARHLDVVVDEVDGVLHPLLRDVAEAVLFHVGRNGHAPEDVDLLDHDLRIERLDVLQLNAGRRLRSGERVPPAAQ